MRDDRVLRTDARAVSTTLGYTMNVAVATLLLTGLLIAGGNVVDDERERTIRAELRVVGQQLAADLTAADRLVVGLDSSAVVRYERDLPPAVAGSPYTVEVVGGADPHLVLSTDDPDVTVRVSLTAESALHSSAVAGGDVVIRWADPDGDADYELEVTND